MKSGSFVTPKKHSDGCSVSQLTHSQVAFNDYFVIQEASTSGGISNFKFNTQRPRQLPVTDISLWLGSGSNEAMAIDFGPVCFSR